MSKRHEQAEQSAILCSSATEVCELDNCPLCYNGDVRW